MLFSFDLGAAKRPLVAMMRKDADRISSFIALQKSQFKNTWTLTSVPKFRHMIEDQVLYHLTKYENKIQSLLTFPERLMPHDEGAFLC